MSVDPVEKLWLLIASTNAPRSDLQAFARWIEAHGSRDFVATVERIRDFAGGEIRDRHRRYRGVAEEPSASRGIVQRIERLLLQDAGLQRKVAAEMLRSLLSDEISADGTLPDFNKISFSSWLDRLANVVPQSLLLHVATKIRNDTVHNKSIDWPLKGATSD